MNLLQNVEMHVNETLNEPNYSKTEAMLNMPEVVELVKERVVDGLQNPPTVVQMHVYWCEPDAEGNYKPDIHGQICIEAVAEYLRALKEIGKEIPRVGIAVGYPNLYEGNHMSSIYASCLYRQLIMAGFTENELEGVICDEHAMQIEDTASETLGEIDFAQKLAHSQPIYKPHLSIGRAFHIPRIRELISESDIAGGRALSAEAILTVLHNGRFSEIVQESDVDIEDLTDHLWKSEDFKLCFMSIFDHDGRRIKKISDITSGPVKEFLQRISRTF